MNADQILHLVAERPEILLALALSAPDRSASRIRNQYSVEITDQHIITRAPLPDAAANRAGLILCSKETICLALLVHALWRERGGPEYEQRLVEQVFAFVSSVVESRYSERRVLSRFFADPGKGVHSRFLSSLDVDGNFLARIEKNCVQAFDTLEAERLAIDPGFVISPGYLVPLLGLVPMEWSVRTPQGENVYRRIRINAPLWSLTIDRYKQGRNTRNDWDFEFRGINFIRRLLHSAAEQYLHAEDNARHAQHRPRLRPPEQLTLDGSRDDE